MVTTAKQNDTTSSTDTGPKSPAGAGIPSFELPSMEEATRQMRELNERLVESSKASALTALDAFEKALKGVGDLEQKAASATHLDWMSTAATTHATFMSDVTAPFTSAVRDLLK
ncbi:hypothetical protein BH11ACT8_BH11ACT8_35730 [soil metagenome]